MMRCSHDGTLCFGGGGRISPARLASRSLLGDSPVNGRLRYSASYSAAQKLNWSLRASATWSYCSGAMYGGVPTSAPAAVRFDVESSSSPCTLSLSCSPGARGVSPCGGSERPRMRPRRTERVTSSPERRNSSPERSTDREPEPELSAELLVSW
jgi:hypothetical protein